MRIVEPPQDPRRWSPLAAYVMAAGPLPGAGYLWVRLWWEGLEAANDPALGLRGEPPARHDGPMHQDDVDPGILGQVPGVAIGSGSESLPPAGPGLPLTAIDVDAAWAGLVRITYRSQRMRHGRNSHWTWVAVSAQRAAEP